MENAMGQDAEIKVGDLVRIRNMDGIKPAYRGRIGVLVHLSSNLTNDIERCHIELLDPTTMLPMTKAVAEAAGISNTPRGPIAHFEKYERSICFREVRPHKHTSVTR